MATRFDDETLMAFADGELDDATSAAVEEAVARDGDLLARVEMFRETRARARSELKPTPEPAVPATLEASVREMIDSSRRTATDSPSGTVLSMDAGRRKPNSTGGGTWQLPLAASLAAAIISGGVGYVLGSREELHAPQLVNASRAGIEEALQTLESGRERPLPGDGRVRIVASFRDGNETLCREYEVYPAGGNPLVAVSCREDGAWDLKFAAATPAGTGGYAPASSADALEAYLAAIGGGPALSADEEARALAESLRDEAR